MSRAIVAGAAVQFRSEPETGGVVLCVEGERALVELSGGRVRQVRRDALRPVHPDHEARVRAGVVHHGWYDLRAIAGAQVRFDDGRPCEVRADSEVLRTALVYTLRREFGWRVTLGEKHLCGYFDTLCTMAVTSAERASV